MSLVIFLALLVGVVLLAAVATSVVIVGENQRGGLVRLGKYTRTLGPGLHIRLPLFDQVTKVDLDGNISGWSGLSERELETAVQTFVTQGSAGRARPAFVSAAPLSQPAPGASDAEALAVFLVMAASEETGLDLSKDPMATERITQRARSAVEELRSSGSCEISLPFLAADAAGPKHFVRSLTRSQVEQALGKRLG